MDTPNLSHLTLKDYEEVYEPAEDSFLMLDALELDLTLIRNIKPLLIIEIGSGSGITITALAKALGHTAQYFATDINPYACDVTIKTSIQNNTQIEMFEMDLFTNFRSNIFDIIIFNPPYVVTESSEIFLSNGIERSWAGGSKGREITDRVLMQVKNMLTDKGLFYLVTIEENDPNDICNIMKKQGFYFKMVIERKIRGEHLKIFRFSLQKF